ncbi:hypothetical protein PG993_010181 [Apiospora rasikravindrae]|uniref:F-box domain-containing protein n=1 Tax=Apiospora rasikravindrae TaxID=990691 RepID=A0ABR1SLJ6_9PEZI
MDQQLSTKTKEDASNSMLLKLPDETIMNILHDIDDRITFLMLRQTCSRLKRLCEDATFKHRLPAHWGTDVQRPNPLQAVGGYMISPREDAKYCRILGRDSMCGDCTKLRGDRVLYKKAVKRIYEAVWCSGCTKYHPAYLFSLAERQKKDPDPRVCIGRQGYLRLCKHHTIEWRYIEDRKKKGFSGSWWETLKPCCICETKPSPLARSYPRASIYFATYLCNAQEPEQCLYLERCLYFESNETIRDVAGCIANVLALDHPLTHCNHVSNWNFLARPASWKAKHGTRFPQYHGDGGYCIMPQCKFDVTIGNYGSTIRVGNEGTISARSPVDPAWLDALDPQSYLSADDELTRGLMWCRNPSCPVMRLGIERYFLFHQEGLPWGWMQFKPPSTGGQP